MSEIKKLFEIEFDIGFNWVKWETQEVIFVNRAIISVVKTMNPYYGDKVNNSKNKVGYLQINLDKPALPILLEYYDLDLLDFHFNILKGRLITLGRDKP